MYYMYKVLLYILRGSIYLRDSGAYPYKDSASICHTYVQLTFKCLLLKLKTHYSVLVYS